MDWIECNKKKIIKEVAVDEEMVASLIKSSKNKLDSEVKLELDEVTAASKISLAYDSLRELLEALAIKNGFKIYNHECYVAFLMEILNEEQKAYEFDELRKTRNDINYYGKEVSVEEARELIKRMKKLRGEIRELFDKN